MVSADKKNGMTWHTNEKEKNGWMRRTKSMEKKIKQLISTYDLKTDILPKQIFLEKKKKKKQVA